MLSGAKELDRGMTMPQRNQRNGFSDFIGGQDNQDYNMRNAIDIIENRTFF
jgi:hypothetical protein